ncbi:MAG: carboxypeptidase regulatory-like domain-containing protein, partial [Bacteroidetes bacterium]
MKRTKLLFFALSMLMLLGIQNTSWSQGTTTAAIEGMVMDMQSQPMADANVVAVHGPTGTRYGTTTRSDGRFNLPNMRVGGPYTLTVSYVGYETDQLTNLQLSLGETRSLLFLMVEAGQVLQEVIVTAAAGSVGQNTGTSTNIDADAIANLPSIN